MDHFNPPFKPADKKPSFPIELDYPAFMSQLYSTGKYSDLIIKCQDKKFKVHKAIVCSQSKPLAAAIDHGFKEAKTGEINLEDDEPEIVEYMIKFLYNGTYWVLAEKDDPAFATSGEDATAAKPDGTSKTEELAPTSVPPTTEAPLITNAIRYMPSGSSGSAVPMAVSNFSSSSNGPSIFAPQQAPRRSGRSMFTFATRTGATSSTPNLFHEVPPAITSTTSSGSAAPTSNLLRQISPAFDFAPPTGSASSNTALFGPISPDVTLVPTNGAIPSTSNIFSGFTTGLTISPIATTASSRVPGSNPSVASTSNLFGNQRTISELASSAISSNDSNSWSPDPGTGWIIKDDRSIRSEAERAARKFRLGLFFGSNPSADESPHIERLAEDLIRHAKVYIIAERYDVQPLKTLARQRYSAAVQTCWNSSGFVKSIELVFDGTPDLSEGDGLRNIVVEAASNHAFHLFYRGEFVQLCNERGDIATAILKAHAKF